MEIIDNGKTRGATDGALKLPLIPLRNMVLFPGVVVPVDVGRPKSLAVTEMAANQQNLHLAFVTQAVAEVEDPGLDDV